MKINKEKIKAIVVKIYNTLAKLYPAAKEVIAIWKRKK